MPYAIEHRGDEWCVIKESDGKSMGCHASRNQALSQQRALYANEAQMASASEVPAPSRIEIVPSSNVVEEALVASVNAISERLVATEELLRNVTEVLAKVAETVVADREGILAVLTAAVNAPVPEAPVVNVTVPEIDVPAPIVHVAVPQQATPDVHVTVEAAEQKQRKVVFERDPLTGQTISASLEEETEEPWLNA